MVKIKRRGAEIRRNIYQQLTPDSEVMRVRILNACDLYANSDIDLKTLSRTYSITENYFIKSFKKLYFNRTLSDEILDKVLEKLINEENYSCVGLEDEFSYITAIRENYYNLLKRRKEYISILKKDEDNMGIKKEIFKVDMQLSKIRKDNIFAVRY